MKLIKKIHLAFLLLASTCASAQFYNLPGDYFFSIPTEKKLAAPDSAVHSGLKPYIHFFSDKYIFVADSHRVYKYIHDDPAIDEIFYKHLIRIEPPHENFRLRLDPLLNFEAGRDLAAKTKKTIYTNTRGFIGSGYIGKKFYFETLFAENQSVFPGYLENFASATTVIPGQGRWKNFKQGGYDYAFASGFISVQIFRNVNLQAGHGKQQTGHGYRSLLLSDNSFNYPFARITQQWFKGRLQYTNIYAALMNLVPASKIPNPNSEILYQKRPAAFQYLSVNVSSRLNIGLFQGVLWETGNSRNQPRLNWQYANPVIYSQLATYGFNTGKHIIAGGDVLLKLTNSFQIYGQAMLGSGLQDTLRNAGYQAGFKWFSPFGIKGLFLQTEYNNVTRNAYGYGNTASPGQLYAHYNQNLAYTPVNGQEFTGIIDYRIKRFLCDIKYQYQATLPGKSEFAYLNILNARAGYLINPAYNLNISLGFTSRTQNFSNFKALNNETNYINLSLRTSIYNLYYDF
jgi:hypothetical protein